MAQGQAVKNVARRVALALSSTTKGAFDRWPWLRRAAIIFLGCGLLCWPGLVNKQPFLFFDTYGYAQHAVAAVTKLSGGKLTLDWPPPTSATALPGARGAAPAATSASKTSVSPAGASDADHDVIASRSVYYGGLIAVGLLFGTLYAVCIAQGLAASCILDICFELFGLSLPRRVAGLLFVSALTPLPFFVSFVMPDVWAGLAILASGCCFFLHPTRQPWGYWCSVAIMSFGALAHTGILLDIVLSAALICGTFFAVSINPEALPILRGRSAAPPAVRPRSGALAATISAVRPRSGALAVTIAAVVGLSGSAAFTQIVKHSYGHPPINLPFLSARLVADGPGARFIRAGCDHAQLEVCKVGANLPRNSEDFLWNPDPKVGVWRTVSPQARRTISNQDTAFAISVLKKYPIAVTYHSAVNSLAQFFDIDMSLFNYSNYEGTALSLNLPRREASNLRATLSFHDAWPMWIMEIIYALAASLLCLGSVAAASGGPGERKWWILAFCFACACGVLINAGICGATSGVFGRYQARVFWILGFVSFCVLASSAAWDAVFVGARPNQVADSWRTSGRLLVRALAARASFSDGARERATDPEGVTLSQALKSIAHRCLKFARGLRTGPNDRT